MPAVAGMMISLPMLFIVQLAGILSKFEGKMQVF